MDRNNPVLDFRPTAGSITAADVASSTASGQSSASIVTGSPTAASFVGWAVDGRGAWRVALTGTFSATVQFEGSVDSGVTWSPLSALVQGTTAIVTSATGKGIFLIPTAGLTNLRARCTSYSSGTVTVTPSVAGGVLPSLALTASIDNTTAGIASVVSSAAESGHVLKSSAGNLIGLDVTTGAAAGYVLIFNSTSVPSNGAVTPIKAYQVAANSSISLSWNPTPIYFSTGISVAFSTTGPFTLTLSATAFISGEVV